MPALPTSVDAMPDWLASRAEDAETEAFFQEDGLENPAAAAEWRAAAMVLRDAGLAITATIAVGRATRSALQQSVREVA